jgi:hypothetical protein
MLLLCIVWCIMAQAVRIQWRTLGPFPIGKAECDGNPAFNAIAKKQKLEYYSEWVQGGKIRWKNAEADHQGFVHINYEGLIDVQGVFQGLNSERHVLEVQTTVIGKFEIQHDGYYIVSCAGVTAFYINDFIFPGDVYFSGMVFSRTKLKAGKHIVRMRFRAEINGRFQFQVKHSNDFSSLIFLNPTMFPQIVDSILPSPWIAIPVFNNRDENVEFKDLSISVFERNQMFKVSLDQHLLALPRIFPNQLITLPLRLEVHPDHVLACLPGDSLKIHFEIVYMSEKFKTNEIELACRSSLQNSFIFTFVDHDHSIQQASAIAPHNPNSLCYSKDFNCPVMSKYLTQRMLLNLKKMGKCDLDFLIAGF